MKIEELREAVSGATHAVVFGKLPTQRIEGPVLVALLNAAEALAWAESKYGVGQLSRREIEALSALREAGIEP